MRTGAIRLFRFAGITVYLHFTWFIVAFITEKHTRGNLLFSLTRGP